MLFNSVDFFVFFFVVYILYLLMNHKQQNYLLIAASLYFYSYWNFPFVFLMIFSIFFTYWLALRIEITNEPQQKKKKLLFGLSVHIGLLAFFKYANLVSPLSIILPLGISFYTFQALGYLIDVYHRDLRATVSLTDFSLFKVFFPQLIAGPIERGEHLLPQIANPRQVTFSGFGYGISLMLWGLFKKVAIADNLAPITDSVFANYATLNALDLWVGVVSFTLQIFSDFSGYSDMARGMAKMMGFDLVVNFNMPFFACNPADFWRRWHISLSSWFRDYVYFPLLHRTGRLGPSVILTFLITGVWHGAGWNFVLLGIYWGILVYVHTKFLQPHLARYTRNFSVGQKRVVRGISIVIMFQFSCFAFLIFRAPDASSLFSIVYRLATTSWSFSGASRNILSVSFYFCVLLLVQLPQYLKPNFDLLRVQSPYWRYATFLSIFYFFLLFYLFTRTDVNLDPREFVYFQF